MSIPQWLIYLLAAILALHGAIHLLGFVAYWPLASVPSLPYRTTLLAGRLQLGVERMRVFAALWLLATVGFLAATFGLARGAEWWPWLLICATVLSMILTTVDLSNARAGVLLNAAIVGVLVGWFVLTLGHA